MREVGGEGRSFSCCSRPFCQINPDSVPNSVSKSHQLLRFPWAVKGGLRIHTAATWLLKSPEGSAEITHPSTPSNCLDAHMSPNLAFICDDRDLICSDGLDTISLRVTFNNSVLRYSSKDSHCSSSQLKSWYMNSKPLIPFRAGDALDKASTLTLTSLWSSVLGKVVNYQWIWGIRGKNGRQKEWESMFSIEMSHL